MQQIKGTILKSRLGFVEQHWGRPGLQRVLEELSDEDRRALEAILTVKWYPFEVGERLDEAIVRVLGDGRTDVFERLGVASADANLTTLHKGFLTPGRPHAFLAKAPQIYRFYYETGSREYEPKDENSGTLTTRDAETFSTPDCLTVVGWYRRALEMCGATGIRIQEPQCRARGDDVCRYELRWEGVTEPAPA
jgi:uncharacterized protein (TIGR02265 family)